MTVFVDTNVLAYAHDLADQRKAVAAISILTELWTDGTGALSTQVLQEFYWVATGKLRPRMTPAEARQVVADYAEWAVIETTPQLIVSASLLQKILANAALIGATKVNRTASVVRPVPVH